MKPYKRSRLRDFAFAIFRPRYWMSNYQASETVDMIINELIDRDEIIEFGRCTVTAKNGIEIWVSNYPYAYGDIKGAPGLLPYRRTRKRLRDHLEKKALMFLNKVTDIE